MSDLHMNKLTMGPESRRSLRGPHFCLQLVFPGFSWPRQFAVKNGQKHRLHGMTEKVTWPLVIVMSLLSMSCRRSANQAPKQFLDYIRELMTSFFSPQPPMTLTYHTYSIMLPSVHCIPRITSYKVIDDFGVTFHLQASCLSSIYKWM